MTTKSQRRVWAVWPIAITIAGAAVLCWVFLAPPGIYRWAKAAYESCNNKLRQIHGAQLMWSSDHGGDTNTFLTMEDLVAPDGYFKERPVCPEGGIYILGRVLDYPRCSIPMHSLEFGHVKAHDEDGWPLGGVSVTLALPGKPLRTATTDQQGKALLTGFPASESTEWANGKVSASLAGFASQTRDVKDGWPMSFHLKREPPSSSQGQVQD